MVANVLNVQAETLLSLSYPTNFREFQKVYVRTEMYIMNVGHVGHVDLYMMN